MMCKFVPVSAPVDQMYCGVQIVQVSPLFVYN